MALELREYQRRAVSNIGRCLAEEPSTLLTMPTGTGKTVVLAHAIREHCPDGKRAMVLAHREELIFQNARTIGAVLGEPCDIERADQHADLPGSFTRARVVVASKDSLHPKRLARFDPSEFGLIITDECFPAGTLIDGVPIESVHVGDEVSCFDHESGLAVRRVTYVFKRRPDTMVRVRLWGGDSLVCTACHPIWSQSRGRYVPAIALDCNDMVSRLTTYAQANLPRLWNDIRVSAAQAAQDMLGEMPVENLVSHGITNQSEVCVGADEGTQPDAVRGSSPEGFGDDASDGTRPGIQGRQRNRADRAGADACGSAGMDHWPCGQDERSEVQRGAPSVALQDRRGERSPKDRCRSRWWFSQVAHSQGTRQEERGFFEAVRVDRIEVLEPGRDRTFGGVCPDGFVYNLEVDEHSNYFANGFLVHNCHHAVAETYTRIYRHFLGVPHLGVTATPDRLDREALGQVFSSEAMTYEIADAIKDGWLVPVKAHTTIVTSLDISGVGTTAGDLNQGELADQLERERPMHEMAASITKECDDRRAIVFTVSVRQAEKLASILNDYKPDCARFVCGETPKDERAAILAAHKRNEFQFLTNVGVLTEGYDDPGASMIVMARPTKSRALFAQMLGRGTRPLPGVVDDADDSPEHRRAAIESSAKPNMMCLDFTGNCGRHKLVTPADVLGGKYDESDILAASLAAQEGDVDVCEALEKARQDREARTPDPDAMEFEASRKRIVAAAKYLLTEEDLFDGAFKPGRERVWLGGRGPTEKQAATLERHGFKPDDIARMSRSECSKIIGSIVSRVHAGLCTVKQAALLSRRGVKDADKLTFEQARERLDRLFGARR